MNDINMKEVYFNEYCAKCKHYEKDQACDECNDCLNTPAREFTHKPLRWESKNE